MTNKASLFLGVVAAAGSVLAAVSIGFPASAQAPAPTPATAAAPPSPPSPAKVAIDVRQSAFTLIGNNFKPVAEVLQGKAQYDSGEAQKRATRIAFLSHLLDEAFPAGSDVGETKAKPEIWTDHDDFDKRLTEFQSHADALQLVAANGKADDFKAAAATLGKDCKGCHEQYRNK
jgi:cytochrome c556